MLLPYILPLCLYFWPCIVSCFVFYQETSSETTDNQQEEIIEISSEDNEEILSPCSICDKTFVDRQSLKSHEREHRKNVSFQCKVCKKTFTQRSSLNLHLYLTKECNTYFEHL